MNILPQNQSIPKLEPKQPGTSPEGSEINYLAIARIIYAIAKRSGAVK